MTRSATQGQGCPQRSRDALFWCARAGLATALVCWTMLAVDVRALLAQAPLTEPAAEIGLRIAFGGGAPRRWVATAKLSSGTFKQPQLLGLDPDEPGSMAVGASEIKIVQRSPRSYDGLDVTACAPLDATLKLELLSDEVPSRSRTFTFTLRDLVAGVHPAEGDAPGLLDAVGNRVVVTRRPGDELRIQYDRPSLVFTPGESFSFHVAPNLIGVEAGASLRMRLAIVSRLDGEEHFVREQDVKVAADGSLAAWGPHDFQLPAGDDVYELDVTLTKRSFLEPLAGVNPLATTRPLHQRRLQFIALATEAPPSDAAPRLELVDEFDPVNNNWSQRVARLPLLKHLPRMKQGQLSYGNVSTRDHQAHRWTQLAADAWQAHPLSITHSGAPHVLEIEYPSDVPQTLGVSVLETNAVGVVAPIGVDSAVEVKALEVGEKPAIARQRLIIWPRTKTPVLLLTNMQGETPAVYGRVRLYRSTGPLAPRLGRPTDKERLVAAWFDKPLFPEMFSATEARDLATTRSLDDWRTFYEGATRLTEYLSHAGYNAVVVPALCEGSTLYPSELLEPTPKYDTGVYLTAGQDPQRKDVLELLLRLCDRAGIKLLPSLQFDAPLPQLEVLLRGDPRERVGLELVDFEGRSWLQRNLPKGGLAPYYNPLDPRVQQAMTNVAGELARRYGHHPSFGGLVLQLSPRGYALLPHAGWGLDDRTFAAFVAASGVGDVGVDADRFALRARYCATTGREAWLAWRAAQMSTLYASMAAEIESVRPGAALVLAGHDMLDSDALRHALRPTLTPRPAADRIVRDALLEIGIDPPAIEKHAGIVLVAPHPLLPTANDGAASDCDETAAAQLQTQLPDRGTLLFREPRTRRLESFDAVSPFGRENTYTWLAAQVTPAGAANRRRWIETIARTEPAIILDGGWMLARGQEQELSDVFATLRSLPPSASTTASDTTQPVVVKTYAGEGKTIACVVNQTPWPLVVKLVLSTNPRVSVTPIGPELKAPPLSIKRGEVAWVFEMPAYGVVSGSFDQPQVKFDVSDVQLPPALEPKLIAELNDLRQRAAALKNPKPMPPIENANFEGASPGVGEIAGWLFARGEGIEVKQSAGGYRESAKALQIVSRGPEVWVRSHPIAVPRTGRVAVWVRLRTPKPDEQPQLRLAIEARRGRQPYYRYATVGAGSSAKLADGWAPFVLQIDDLPREGLDEFRIGFDLMGAGEVWIDDVEIYETSFTADEQFRISQQIAVADSQLRENNAAVAGRLLDGYWPRFLLQHIDAPPAAETPGPLATPSAPATNEPQPTTTPTAAKKGWFRWVSPF